MGQNPSFTVMLQARLGSSRLPGKVLLDFNGVPLIEHIYNQVRSLKDYKLNFVLSTSNDPLDDSLVAWAAKIGIQTFRHPVDDIAGRLFGSYSIHSDTGLIRIWGDCVFICPDVISSMLTLFTSKKLDYITNAGDSRNLPVGLDAEIYSAQLLQNLNACPDPFLREYPLQYVLKNSQYLTHFYRHPVAMDVLNLTVDYPEDLIASRIIASQLQETHPTFGFNELFELYQTKPNLFDAFSKAERQKEFKDKFKTWLTKGD